LNKRAPVYVHKEAFEPHYNGTEKYIGLDPSLASHPRLIPTSGTINIGDRLTLFDANDRARLFAPIPSGLTTRRGDDFLPDDFRHEQYLLIEENGKKVLISGCSHKGILDIAEWFSPDALVGGFHFSKMPLDGALAEAARTLTSHSTAYYTCHCTGEAQFAYMKQYMWNLRYLSCGEVIEI
jgi:7,8-dihydropterin-6-yl-methyl-4-(beta-D-ribofuranosyl)aminobenzene 5'-phosphate synthase